MPFLSTCLFEAVSQTSLRYAMGIMMKTMLDYLKQKGYSKTSLAVQKDNYALKMYLKVGFQIVDENEEEFIMIYYLK